MKPLWIHANLTTWITANQHKSIVNHCKSAWTQYKSMPILQIIKNLCESAIWNQHNSSANQCESMQILWIITNQCDFAKCQRSSSSHAPTFEFIYIPRYTLQWIHYVGFINVSDLFVKDAKMSSGPHRSIFQLPTKLHPRTPKRWPIEVWMTLITFSGRQDFPIFFSYFLLCSRENFYFFLFFWSIYNFIITFSLTSHNMICIFKNYSFFQSILKIFLTLVHLVPPPVFVLGLSYCIVYGELGWLWEGSWEVYLEYRNGNLH